MSKIKVRLELRKKTLLNKQCETMDEFKEIQNELNAVELEINKLMEELRDGNN